MKFPAHILLDISRQNLSNSSQYWIFKYMFFLQKKNPLKLDNIFIHKKFILNQENLFSNNLIKNQKDFTVKYSLQSAISYLTQADKNFITKAYAPRLKVNKRVLESKNIEKNSYDFLTSKNFKFNEKSLKYLIKNFYMGELSKFSSNSLWSLFDINFLRKERIYTKLKYSRVPQYDIVSGGAAALFAAFIGFLISEKFGFELPDSGDFYFIFMYIVFTFFFCRLFLKITDANQSTWNPFSFKWLIFFYRNLFFMFLKYLNYILNLIKNFFII